MSVEDKLEELRQDLIRKSDNREWLVQIGHPLWKSKLTPEFTHGYLAGQSGYYLELVNELNDLV